MSARKDQRARKPNRKPRHATDCASKWIGADGRPGPCTCGVEPPPAKPPTVPEPTRLAQIRERIGQIDSRAHRALAALDGADEAAAVDAVSELSEAGKHEAGNAVTVLLHAALDVRPAVRAAAAGAMSCQPYGAIRDRLAEMLEDADLVVKASASKALDDMRDLRPPCIQCGSDGYDLARAVRLPESSDPHGAFVFWPVFCSSECAVEYALDRVREDVDRGGLHECLISGQWERCSAEGCDACTEAEAVGRGPYESPEGPC